jgi:hypothetical protein
MENNFINNLVLYRGKSFAGLVDTNKISYLSAQAPAQIATVISYVFGNLDSEYSTSIDAITGGLGNVMTIDKSVFEWKVVTNMDRAVTIRRAQWNGEDVVVGTTPGLNNTPITIWLEEDWFGPGAIIEFDNRDYRVRLTGEPVQDGSLWRYVGYVADGRPTSYIPYEYLKNGCQVSRLTAAYEEFSEEADILNYHSYFEMRNYLFTTRLKHDITGSAFSEVMAIGIRDAVTGKTFYLWQQMQEFVAMREWVKRMEAALVYNHSSVRRDGTCMLKGTNGRPVIIGAGLLEQISPSNIRTYTVLTADLIEDFLFDLSYNILALGERKFVAFTGEMGMREFDRILKVKAASMQLIDTVFITGTGNQLKMGGQFSTYSMNNGIELTVKRFPLFDDLTSNRLLHPVTLKPLSSYNFLFLDITRRDGQANIVKIVRKGREFVTWYTGGSVGPDGYAHSTSQLRSNGKDGYTVYYLGEVGIMVRDPRSCGMLVCDAEPYEA